MRFQEEIPGEEVVEVGGAYNEDTKMWEWPKDPDNLSMEATFQEHPPTLCITPTRIDPRRTAADTEHDD